MKSESRGSIEQMNEKKGRNRRKNIIQMKHNLLILRENIMLCLQDMRYIDVKENRHEFSGFCFDFNVILLFSTQTKIQQTTYFLILST